MAAYVGSAALRVASFAFKKLGGSFVDVDDKLSDAAQQLVDDAFSDLDCSKIIDYHTHIIGQETDGTGCYCHPAHFAGTTPDSLKHRFKANVFLVASGVSSDDTDEKFVERLLSLIRSFCPKEKAERDGGHLHNCILAFDYVYTPDGKKDVYHSGLYIPNNYIFKLVADHGDAFLPTCSIHPFRKDCLDEMRRCAELGVRIIKWLPNSQMFSPGDERCDKFYRLAKELDMIILCHTGSEHAITAGNVDDSFGNPLLLRRALDNGAKVIMAHCASEGKFPDLDKRGSDGRCPQVAGIDLFLRLMDEEKYKDLLFADISALIGILRCKHLRTLLEATSIHDRLVFGSDYPVPAINMSTSTRLLQKLGLLEPSQCTPLNEIYTRNPLLYDFVVKRTISYNGKKFPAKMFQEHPKLQVLGKHAPERLRAVLAVGNDHADENADLYENDEALLGSLHPGQTVDGEETNHTEQS